MIQRLQGFVFISLCCKLDFTSPIGGRLAQMRVTSWLIDGDGDSARALTSSVNSTTNGLSDTYNLLVELGGQKTALEFSAAVKACWSYVRKSIESAQALQKFIAQAAARKLSTS